jgi:hypothetical protein
MAKAVKGEPKKPYSKPTLIVFGTVRDLTQSLGPRGTKDGGTGLGHKHTKL